MVSRTTLNLTHQRRDKDLMCGCEGPWGLEIHRPQDPRETLEREIRMRPENCTWDPRWLELFLCWSSQMGWEVGGVVGWWGDGVWAWVGKGHLGLL